MAEEESEAIEEEEPQLKTMSLGLFDAPPPAGEQPPAPRTFKIAVSAEPGKALVFCLDAAATDDPITAPLRALLAEEQTSKSLHDLKAALRILGRHGAEPWLTAGGSGR